MNERPIDIYSFLNDAVKDFFEEAIQIGLCCARI